jgi:hypothetical protein
MAEFAVLAEHLMTSSINPYYDITRIHHDVIQYLDHDIMRKMEISHLGFVKKRISVIQFEKLDFVMRLLFVKR